MSQHEAKRANVLNFVNPVGQTYAATGSEATAAGRLVALLSACFICTHARVDPDLWGHLRFGLDAVASGDLPITDPYSFTQDVPWINHEWLSEVAQAIAYRAGGVLGLVLLKAVILAAAFAILADVSREIDARFRWWLLAASIIGVAPAAFTMRPQIWTLLAIPLLWTALNNVRGRPFDARPEPVEGRAQGKHVGRPLRWVLKLLAIPALFALWANLHGGWIVGMGVGALWLVGRAIDRWTVSKPTWSPPLGGPEVRLKPDATGFETGAALAAGLAATLLNPYGWQLWRFLLTTVRPSRAISEWRPVWEQDDVTSALIWAVIMLVIVAPTLARRRAAITWAGALPVAWLGVMSLFVARLVPLFGEVALLGLASAWRSLDGIGAPAAARPPGRLIVDAVAVAAISVANLVTETRCLAINDNWTPDLHAASALASPTAQGRLVLPFNWGEYAIWHFGPRLRVSIDGRRETVYSDRVVGIQSAAAHGLPAGLEYLRHTRPEYVWLLSSAAAPTAAWLKANGYRVDVDTGTSFVASRGDLPPLTIAAPLPRCFP
jgi:hypothetical protein